nr:uncharacterized protein LOC118088520 [Zootoca vivipara]
MLVLIFLLGRRCPPVNIANGRVVIPSERRLGDEITLGCIEGYKLIGEKTLQCVEVGDKLEWHKSPPFCHRIRCYDPPTILFGSHSGQPHEEYFYGSTVTYTCNANFSLIGSTTSTCSDSLTSTSGVWLPAPPRCRAIRCDREPEIPNGRVVKKPQRPYTYGVRVTFVCDPGYVMVGQDTCTCGPDHGWIPRFPKCVRDGAPPQKKPSTGGGEADDAGEEDAIDPGAGVQNMKQIGWDGSEGSTERRKLLVSSTFEDEVLKMLSTLKEGQDKLQETQDKHTEEFKDLKKEIGTLTQDVQQVKTEVAGIETRVMHFETVRVQDLESQHYQTQVQIAFLQMRERQMNLRIRGFPEIEKEDLKATLIQEFMTAWELTKSLGIDKRIIGCNNFLEVLLTMIRDEEKVKGIVVGAKQYKLKASADDLVLTMQDPETSVIKVLDIIQEFGRVAAFKLNKTKTKVLEKHLTLEGGNRLQETTGLMFVKKVKYLGVNMTATNLNLYKDNYEKMWNEIKRDLDIWSNLKLSLMGEAAARAPLPEKRCRRLSLRVESFSGSAPSLCFSAAEGAAALSLSPTPGSLSCDGASYQLPWRGAVSVRAAAAAAAAAAVFLAVQSSRFRTSSEFLFPSDCTHPHVANATLRSGDPKDSYPAGTVLRYRCIAGYDPIPGETLFLTCLDTSKWSIENPRFCQGQLCPPVNIANGRVVIPSGGRLGDEITLGCIQGYKLVGERTLRCVEVAGKLEWHKPPPICRRIRCYDPPTILFGSHSGQPHEEYFYGSTVTYTCNANFSLIGSTTSTCSDSLTSTSGVWLPAPPRCRVIRCDREPEIPNGRVIKKPQRPYTYGVRVTFVCDPGYVMVGQDTCTCGPDHGWIPRFPKCVRGPGTVPPGDNTGPTHNPETPAGDDTESEYTTATIIGCLTVLMVVVVVVAGMWKIRSYMKTGEAETLSRSGRFDMSVAKSGLEPKGYKNPSLLQ